MRTKRWGGPALKARAKKFIVAALIGSTLMASFAGCYGKFPLTKAVYRLNGDITNNKIIHSIIFWIFIILPVYDLAFLVDAIILNLIEFWTGESLSVSSATLDDGTRVTLAPCEDEKTAILTVEKPDGSVLTTQFERVSEIQMNVIDGEGNVAGYIYRTSDGGMLLCDAKGETVRNIGAADLQALAMAAAQ